MIPSTPNAPPHGPAVVLVIDDSDVDRATMIDILSRAGFDAHGLPSPIGATKAARQLGARVVVIDQNLPALDGNKLATLFRSNPLMRGVSVVLVSGAEEKSMREVARTAQVDAFVTKADLHKTLASTVTQLLRS